MKLQNYPTEIKIIALSAVLALPFLLTKSLVFSGVMPASAPAFAQAIVKAMTQYEPTQEARMPGKKAAGNRTVAAPVSKPAASAGGFKFDGIIYDPGGNSQIILNNEIYSPGQSVNGYLITRIDQNEATLTKDDKTYRMSAEGLREAGA